MRQSTELLSELLRDLARGDQRAFQPLYNATSLKLFGIVIRILKQRETAEDVLQDVYVRIWENAARFDPSRASPITWMATIARNRALDELRRREPSTVAEPENWHEIGDEEPLPSDQVELRDDLRRLEACLDGLEVDRRNAIKLAYLDGFSRKALAERFSQPVGTIKTWLHRGLKQLKDCLGE